MLFIATDGGISILDGGAKRFYHYRTITGKPPITWSSGPIEDTATGASYFLAHMAIANSGHGAGCPYWRLLCDPNGLFDFLGGLAQMHDTELGIRY